MSYEEKRAVTIGDSVYYSLRKNIMYLNLKPGESINTKEIAEQLGVSRSPVRDSLIKLQKEGLITTIPKKGTIISKIDLNRVEEERFLRLCVEEKVLLLFLKCHSDSDLAELKDNLEKQKECISKKDMESFLEYDDQFHEVFFRVSNKMLCWEALDNMSGHYRRVRFMALSNVLVVNYVIDQHERFLKLILDENVEDLKILIELHITQQNKEEKALIEEYPDYFHCASDDIENFLKKDFLKMIK
ncbi:MULTISPECIES: GntR family transcriptional regulator [Clostridium]|uniref:GntR family transcriptional regulator n=1 Tax=Clostridium frigoriphilum TaxID=443253 RepID=A0ABU7UV82_9CLOT|nr:GntR family transcriptional regulator [Clostridium sp. DSM 17811]MBU3102299.1 GntR family transcriptional regulator [Clostridium sp. DSM 17811]